MGGGCPSPSLLLSPRPRFCFLFANLDSSVSSKVDRVPEGPGRMGSAGSCSQGRWPAVSALVAPGELGRQGWRRFCWPQCPGRGVSPWAEARVSGSKQCPHFISAAAAAAASSLSCELVGHRDIKWSYESLKEQLNTFSFQQRKMRNQNRWTGGRINERKIRIHHASWHSSSPI